MQIKSIIVTYILLLIYYVYKILSPSIASRYPRGLFHVQIATAGYTVSSIIANG